MYRTIEDLLAIEEYARTAATGAVVGGGLLGLEAAGALKGLGLAAHIVEFAPRLMPVQVDEGGGAALLRTIEGMGLSVHTGVGTQEIVTGPDGAVTGMKLSDGSELATDLVVFSAGVRPRDQLARDCGLAVGERGGIAVDEQCRTVTDPHVFAIGECALAADGRATWLERIPGGLDHVRDVVVHDSLGICDELEALMAAHVAGYRDEWAETVNDPEKLARFVSFVNAPGTRTRWSASCPNATR
ncbi:Nitric oxide reductase FlRd-NAD(+) reductase [Streptomyces fumanus]